MACIHTKSSLYVKMKHDITRVIRKTDIYTQVLRLLHMKNNIGPDLPTFFYVGFFASVLPISCENIIHSVSHSLTHIEQRQKETDHDDYRKNSKQICCNHPKIWTNWLYCSVMRTKDGWEGIANSADPDQTAALGLFVTGLSFRKLRIITVNKNTTE